MGALKPNIPLPRNEWIDLYVASGIATGSQLKIQNTGSGQVRLYDGATQPAGGGDTYAILPMLKQTTNESGDLGCWAWCSTGSQLSVSEA